MSTRKRLFGWLVAVQLLGALCVSIPTAPTPTVRLLQSIGGVTMEPAATLVRSARTSLGLDQQPAEAQWPRLTPLLPLPLNLLFWWMLLQVFAARINFEPVHPAAASALRR